jgi:hypothetical protein
VIEEVQYFDLSLDCDGCKTIHLPARDESGAERCLSTNNQDCTVAAGPCPD